jgi:hypothetical protein
MTIRTKGFEVLPTHKEEPLRQAKVRMNDEFSLYEAVLFEIASCHRAHEHRLKLTLADHDDARELSNQVGEYSAKEVTIMMKRQSCPVLAACSLLHAFGHFWSDKVHGNPVGRISDLLCQIRAGRADGTRDQRTEILEEEVRAWYLGTFTLFNIETAASDESFGRCILEYDRLARSSLRDCGEELELGRDAFCSTAAWPYLQRWLSLNLPKSIPTCPEIHRSGHAASR